MSKKSNNRSLKNKLKEANLLVQCHKNNYDYNKYTYGFYNGMELILALFEERKPIYLDIPKAWKGSDSNKIQCDECKDFKTI